MRHVAISAKVVKDNTGIITEIPAIMTEHGLLEPLLNYFLVNSHAKSLAWMTKVVQSVRLLLDYMGTNQNCFDDPKELFTTFAQRLYSGTIDDDGIDPSRLYWMPQSSCFVRPHLTRLTDFSEWMTDQLGTKPLNPWRNATTYEEMLNWAAYHQHRNRSFLGHTWSQVTASSSAKRARNFLLKRSPKIEHDGVKFFPEEHFPRLLFKGFIIPGKQNSPRIGERCNLRDILITMLLHYGGLRESEPLHLYVHDVLPDPKDPEVAFVRIFHPVEGMAPDDWYDPRTGKTIRCNREAYLLGKYQISPRSKVLKYRNVGWKECLLDDDKGKFMHVHWIPTWAGKLFLRLWNHYIIQRALIRCDHPFAFVSLSGQPYALRAYNAAHGRAVARIGLVAAKGNGTTPHGHRHAYGQRMTDANIDPIFRKKALHHKSLESQIPYTEPTVTKVSDAMERATAALDAGQSEPLDLMRYGFEGVDPNGLLSGPWPKLGGG